MAVWAPGIGWRLGGLVVRLGASVHRIRPMGSQGGRGAGSSSAGAGNVSGDLRGSEVTSNQELRDAADI